MSASENITTPTTPPTYRQRSIQANCAIVSALLLKRQDIDDEIDSYRYAIVALESSATDSDLRSQEDVIAKRKISTNRLKQRRDRKLGNRYSVYQLKRNAIGVRNLYRNAVARKQRANNAELSEEENSTTFTNLLDINVPEWFLQREAEEFAKEDFMVKEDRQSRSERSAARYALWYERNGGEEGIKALQSIRDASRLAKQAKRVEQSKEFAEKNKAKNDLNNQRYNEMAALMKSRFDQFIARIAPTSSSVSSVSSPSSSPCSNPVSPKTEETIASSAVSVPVTEPVPGQSTVLVNFDQLIDDVIPLTIDASVEAEQDQEQGEEGIPESNLGDDFVACNDIVGDNPEDLIMTV